MLRVNIVPLVKKKGGDFVSNSIVRNLPMVLAIVIFNSTLELSGPCG